MTVYRKLQEEKEIRILSTNIFNECKRTRIVSLKYVEIYVLHIVALSHSSYWSQSDGSCVSFFTFSLSHYLVLHIKCFKYFGDNIKKKLNIWKTKKKISYDKPVCHQTSITYFLPCLPVFTSNFNHIGIHIKLKMYLKPKFILRYNRKRSWGAAKKHYMKFVIFFVKIIEETYLYDVPIKMDPPAVGLVYWRKKNQFHFFFRFLFM